MDATLKAEEHLDILWTAWNLKHNEAVKVKLTCLNLTSLLERIHPNSKAITRATEEQNEPAKILTAKTSDSSKVMGSASRETCRHNAIASN